ncbi:fibronectin type III domain-containing protein [Paenibacillus xylanexedens]|uniref:fibronectin type III domain-containing protein n=1 Tax=Paenibacillus xylanexedens TaxID=528191 RepID=UPI00119E7CE0|nr:fibronectin type III domain-containing protein [Paenibacillus xylanexedens]
MKKATAEKVGLQRHLSHPTKNAKSYLNKMFSSFMAIVLFVSLHSFPVWAASGITSNSYPGFYGIPSATTQAANGDLYLAYPEMGTIQGGSQGIKDFKIYKWTSASNSFSLETSVNAAVGLNQFDVYYGELKMAVDTNGTLHVAFIKTGSFHDLNWYSYTKGIYYGTYNTNSNSWSNEFSEMETQGLPTQLSATRYFYTSLQLQVNSLGEAAIAYVKNSNTSQNDYHIKIKVGSNSNTTWSETILNTGDNVSVNSLLDDNNGNFSVVYSVETGIGPDIYVSSAPFATSAKVLTGDDNYYSYYGSAIDSSGHIYVVYSNLFNGGFGIASNTGSGGSWETTIIDSIDVAATTAIPSGQPNGSLVIDENDNMFIFVASIDTSTYQPASFYYYGKFSGNNTWNKGLIDIPELSNLLGKSLNVLYPFAPSTGNLMLQYFDGTNMEAGYVSGKQTDFFASSGLSGDATLTSVLGQTLTTGSEAGTTSAPKTATIEVSNGVSSVSAGDIVKQDAGATVTFYGTDSTFVTPDVGSVNLTSGSGTDVYIKVVAEDNTTLYYKISINRMAPISNFVNTAKTSTTASFSWTAASGATGIVIEQSPAGANTWTTAQTSGAILANATSAAVTGLNPATSYDFRLVVTGGTNAGTSNVVSNITTDNAPSVPLTDFASTAKTSTSASFSWTAANGATGLVIEQSPAGTNTWTTSSTSGALAANATSGTVTGLNPATTYDFRLVVTGGTNAGTSNIVSNVTTDNAPSVPLTDFASTAKTSTSASFSWTAASGATGLVIEQSPAGTNTWTTASTSGALATNATSATVTGLNPATSYDFRLVVTGGTNAGTSNIVSNVTTDNAPSVPLTDFANTAKTSTSASFSWTAASGATGIVIEQSPAGTNTWTTASTGGALAANATSATVTGLNPATSYDFRLVVTGGTNAGPSNVVSNITTDNAPSVPLTDFANTAKMSTSASFSWTAASGATGLVIEQSPAGTNTWTTASTSGTLATNATSGTVTGLNPATSYDFRLVVTGGTNAGTSNVVSNITTDNAPSVPLTDFASTAKTSTSANFSWTAASGATGIVIEQSPAGANTWTTAQTSGTIAANATSGTVTGLNPAMSYDFRLVVTGGTNAGTSNVVSNITTDNAPSVPLTDFASTAKTSTSASFSWTAASGATGLVIEQSPAGTNTWTTSSTSGALATNATSGTVTGLNPATSYDFRLVVTGGTNAGPSNMVSNITTDNAPSVPLTDFANTAKTSTSASFSWTEASGATGLVIEQSPAGTNTWTTASTSGTLATNATSATVTGLNPATSYDFRLVVTGGTNAGTSNVVSNITTDNASSVPLTDFANTAKTSTSASFSWTEASGATGLVIEQSPAGANTWTTAQTSGAILANATSGTVTGLNPATSYDFRLVVTGGTNAGASNVVSNVSTNTAPNVPNVPNIPNVPSSPTSPVNSSSGSGAPSSGTTGVDILVNGKVESAGTATTSQRNNQSVTTISVDQNKLDNKLASEGSGAVVTLPVNTKSDIVIGELNGQMIKNLESYSATLEIRTARATYTLPAQQININALSAQLGKELNLQDIKVRIEIAAPITDMMQVVDQAAGKNGLTLVAPPTDFKISATYGSTTIDVSKFNAYVERSVALPNGIDPNKITTGLVVEPDGSVRHVPTKVIFKEGMYYARINSLTNSTYTVVWHPLEFSDVAKHWAKKAVNDMGSRMIVNGTGNEQFNPDQDITRAEFAASIVRGLGLKLENETTLFSDVKSSDWYSSVISTAYAYELLDGYPDGTFRPMDKITREQAMVILSKAMTLTRLKEKQPVQSTDGILHSFQDAASVSQWAQSSVMESVQAGIISGRSATALVPKAYITRAEVATIIQKLLQKSELI